MDDDEPASPSWPHRVGAQRCPSSCSATRSVHHLKRLTHLRPAGETEAPEVSVRVRLRECWPVTREGFKRA
jgi:hypothetical protein